MKNISSKIFILSTLLCSVLSSSLFATDSQRINVLIFKENGFESNWKNKSGHLNNRINSNVQEDIDKRKKFEKPTPPSTPTIDDSQCNKQEGELCTLTFNATDDGRLSWNIVDTNSNTLNYIKTGNSVTFTVPRFGQNVNISGTRTDNDSLSSSNSYSFTSLQDIYTAFKNTLINICGIPTATVNRNFNKTTGSYNGSINCSNKNLQNTDLDTFKVLNNVNGSLLLNNNLSLSSLSGLKSGLNITSGLYIQNTNIKDMSPLNSVTIGNMLSISLYDKILDKKMSKSSPYCSKSTMDLTLYSTLTTNQNITNKADYGYIICSNTYNNNDVSFLTTLKDKCGMSGYNLQFKWNSDIGEYYQDSILCGNKGLVNRDISGFTVLKSVTNSPRYFINLSKNNLTDLTPLSNLTNVGNLYLNDNLNLSSLSGLKSNLNVTSNLYLQNTQVKDMSQLNSMTIGNLSISLYDKILDKKMSKSSPYCSKSTMVLTLYSTLTTNQNITNKFDYDYIICSDTYNNDDVNFVSILSDKCGISKYSIQFSFNDSLDYYGNYINCSNKNLVNTDLDIFKVLTRATDISLSSNNLTNVNGLINIKSLGSLNLNSNTNLSDLSGLINLTNVGNFISIQNNTNLTNISGLSNITSTPRTLFVDDKLYTNGISVLSTICSNWTLRLSNNTNALYSNVCH